jgi:adenine C2-methylase RlmN of 23S rRNA A2503 and tRNA A37
MMIISCHTRTSQPKNNSAASITTLYAITKGVQKNLDSMKPVIQLTEQLCCDLIRNDYWKREFNFKYNGLVDKSII